MTTPAPPLLSMRGIEKSFGGVQALRGAAFEATAGEIHALCGENGAGKSTLLKVLTGVVPRGEYKGDIALEGRPVGFASTTAALHAGIAIVHQELMLVPGLSVAENLLLGREPRRFGFVDDAALEAAARKTLARFGLAAVDPTTPVGDLGIGVQQMIEIARALSHDARLLVLDEPTAALTTDETERLMGLLRDLRAKGTACVYVSHRMDEIFALCDRVTVLRDGQTVGTVRVAETSANDVVRMMIGREVQAARPARPSPEPERAISVQELSLVCGRRRVLSNVTLDVRKREIVAVCGAMGAGRTALLSTLFGCGMGERSGTVRLGGAEVGLESPSDAISRGLALVPEDRKGRGLVLDMSVAENLALPSLRALGRLGFVDDAAEGELARRRIQELSIRGQAHTRAGALSGGNQQKVVLGKWLETPPKVLLLDEPTRGVDVGAREEIYGLLEALAAKGTAILFASSDLPEVLRLADRVVVMRAGAVVGHLAQGEATQEKIVELATGATAPALLTAATATPTPTATATATPTPTLESAWQP
jgi:ABC-type sugar transport system ATPase subunit